MATASRVIPAPPRQVWEILANGWLTCPVDAGLIFDPDFGRKYDRALAILGVDEGMLSSDAGHA